MSWLILSGRSFLGRTDVPEWQPHTLGAAAFPSEDEAAGFILNHPDWFERHAQVMVVPASPISGPSILVGMPCHHPAWPMHCDRCGRQADGFNVTQRLGGGHAYSLVGMACLSCMRAVLCEPKMPVPAVVDMAEMIREVRESMFFRRAAVTWMGRSEFQVTCEGTPEVTPPA